MTTGGRDLSGYGECGKARRQRLSRARFLRLAGAGGVGLSLASLGLGRAAFSQTSPLARPEILVAGGEYPIGLWSPPPPEYTTPYRYKQIREAGFNFVIGGNGVTTDRNNMAALDAAEANGLKFLLVDRQLRLLIDGAQAMSLSSAEAGSEYADEQSSLMQLPAEQRSEPAASSSDMTAQATATSVRDEVRQRIAELVASYGDHPALAGINLYDEPHRSLFGLLAFAKSEVLRQFGADELPFVNVWPSYASPRLALGTSDYATYLERYCEVVSPPLLCFNHYPLLAQGKVTGDYFHNWAVIRRYSRLHGIPSWVFIQSVGFDGSALGLARRRAPTEAEIFWQINVSLAYGAKGIQYFTYWTPNDRRVDFGDALISRDSHTPTKRYHYAASANRYLGVIGKVLLPLVSESVVHAREGSSLPRGAIAFRADPYVRAVDGSKVILSRFRNNSWGTKDRYLLVANRSYSRAAESRLTLTWLVSRVSEVNRETGALVPVSLVGSPPKNLVVKIPPGRARLYLLRTGS